MSAGKLKEKNHLEDTNVDGKTTLRWIIINWK
jgi:hypothetical protein